MLNKYVAALENRQVNDITGKVWTVNDVPRLWNEKVISKIEEDGYTILEDGTVG